MPKSYSCDLRQRVIGMVEAGASRHEAAEHFGVSVSSVVKWMQRWNESRSVAPKPRGGSISPLEAFATEILALVAERPDLTLVETVAALRKRRIKTSRSALWRFLDRHNITLKKKPARGRTFRGERELGGKVAAALARKEERRAEAARRKHFSAGRVRHRDFGSGCRTAGPDPGRNCGRAPKTAHSNQPQFAVALFSPARDHL